MTRRNTGETSSILLIKPRRSSGQLSCEFRRSDLLETLLAWHVLAPDLGHGLGNTGLLVSPIALGTMQFGWGADEAASHAILSSYLDGGGNLIDTADCYSVWAPNNPGGISEQIIGRWLKASGNRDRVLVATKVRAAMGQDFSEGDDHPLQREGLSRRWILRACEDSLRRLQVDYIDLYQAHYIDP